MTEPLLPGTGVIWEYNKPIKYGMIPSGIPTRFGVTSQFAEATHELDENVALKIYEAGIAIVNRYIDRTKGKGLKRARSQVIVGAGIPKNQYAVTFGFKPNLEQKQTTPDLYIILAIQSQSAFILLSVFRDIFHMRV